MSNVPFVEHEDFGAHSVGDDNCQRGWCNGCEYPKPCGCGGLIHAEYDEEDWDNVYLKYKCDKCNSTNSPNG